MSLGCVRLEHADRLAQWLLGRDAAPPSDAPEQHVQIDQGVPVYLTYLTANVEEGKLAFATEFTASIRPRPRWLRTNRREPRRKPRFRPLKAHRQPLQPRIEFGPLRPVAPPDFAPEAGATPTIRPDRSAAR